MTTDHDIRARPRTNRHLCAPRPGTGTERDLGLLDYTYPNAWTPRIHELRQLELRPLSKILVQSLLKAGDPTQVANSKRPLFEFVRGQLQKVPAWKQRERLRPRVPTGNLAFAPGLWVNDDEYFAWTHDGQLVVVKDPTPENGFSSPVVRRPTDRELRNLLAVDRLVTVVIAVCSGDSLEHGVVTGYILHHDLEGAVQAALDRATETERKAAAELARREKEEAAALGFRGVPLQKTRFRPEGNFVLYRPPSANERLPPFVVVLLEGAPPAFGDRRHAIRFLQKRRRLGALPDGCGIARVLASANVRPTFRRGFKRPKHRREIAALVHKEPRLVRPQLHVEWRPRYFQDDDGVWRLEPFKLRRTVRHGVRDRLLERLRDTYLDLDQRIEEHNIRSRLGQREGPGYEAVVRHAL